MAWSLSPESFRKVTSVFGLEIDCVSVVLTAQLFTR